MNKNTKSKEKISSKGFYAALGISAVMVGSACYFAYNESNKKAGPETVSKTSEAVVDNKQDNVPKQTTASPYVNAAAVTTAAVTTSPVNSTVPIIVTVPVAVVDVIADNTDEKPVEQPATEYKPPLADISVIINEFSGNELVKNATTGSWQTHNGVDIAAAKGDDVRVIADGEVVAINDDPLWGTSVTVDHHNGYTSKYCGLSKDLNVQPGQILIAGDVIGVLGDTCDIESSLDSHLHIEVAQNGKYVDPLELFRD